MPTLAAMCVVMALVGLVLGASFGQSMAMVNDYVLPEDIPVAVGVDKPFQGSGRMIAFSVAGQGYCADLRFPKDVIFEEDSMRQMARKGTGRKDIKTLDECLTTCVQTEGCYGIDWNFKIWPFENTRCWIHMGDVANFFFNSFVNHYRRLPCPVLGWPVIEREFSNMGEWQGYFMPNVFTYTGHLAEISYFWGEALEDDHIHEDERDPLEEFQAAFQTISLEYAAKNFKMAFGVWRRATYSDVPGFEVFLFSAGHYKPGVNTAEVSPSRVKPGDGLVIMSFFSTGEGTFNYDKGGPEKCGETYSGDFRRAVTTTPGNMFIDMSGIEIMDLCIIPSVQIKVIPDE